MAALLCAKDLCKTYVIDKRQNNVLKNVNLEVKEGEMVAIMGPSGSGKSTLLYAVSGMDRATSGQVLFEGKDLTKLSEKELAKIRLDEMGFIFQQMHFLEPHNNRNTLYLQYPYYRRNTFHPALLYHKHCPKWQSL